MKRGHRGLTKMCFVFLSVLALSGALLSAGNDKENRKADAAGALSFTEQDSFVDRDTYNNSYFGQGLGLGDINGDGYEDLMVPARMYNTGGRLYIFFGGSTVDTTADLVVSSECSRSAFPTNNSTNIPATDLDSDGYDDVIIGGPGYDSGRAYTLFGSSSLSGDKSAADYVFVDGNPTAKRYLGSSAGAGDVNGDGNQDIIVSAPLSDIVEYGVGAVFVYYGDGDNTPDQTEDKTLTPPESGYFLSGEGGIIIGDVNGDGYDDILVGGGGSAAKVYLWYGGADMDTTYDVLFQTLGADVSPGGLDIHDINEDGYGDVCIGAYKADSGGDSDIGKAYCFFGSASLSGDKTAETDADITFVGVAEDDNFGRSLKTHDVNNDGNYDLIVGAYQSDGDKDGYIQVFLGDGSTIETSPDSTITIAEPADRFGQYLSAGDMNGNGWADIYGVSAEGGNGTGVTGKVYRFEVDHGDPSATPDSLSPTSDPTPDVTGTAADSEGGYTIANVQWSFGSETTSEWEDCTASDGSFNTSSEPFTCNIHGSDLVDGDYTVYFRTVDNNDLYMSPKLYGSETFTVDTTPPAVNAETTEETYTEGDDVVIEGTAEDETSAIADVEYSLDGGNTWESAAPDDGAFDSGSEGFTITLSGLAAGDYTVIIRVTDAAGNVLSEYTVDASVGEGSGNEDSNSESSDLSSTGEMIVIGVGVGVLAFTLSLYFAFRFKNRLGVGT